jgi:hypothetical protein
MNLLLRCPALAAYGFVAMSTVESSVSASSLDMYAERRGERYKLKSRQGGQPRSAAFGSSHGQNALDPTAFDKTLSESIVSIHSLILAVEGSHQVAYYAIYTQS